MVSRLLLGLALGLLMYMPRPTPRPEGGPPSLPPGEDLPPGAGRPPGIELPPGDVDPGFERLPQPDLGEPPTGPHVPGPMPSVPPTPPPGYEGSWPPGGDTEALPPTGPPGHEGTWPPSGSAFRERVLDLIRQLRQVVREDTVADARAGARAASEPLGASDPQA